jgi:hypothetical protein
LSCSSGFAADRAGRHGGRVEPGRRLTGKTPRHCPISDCAKVGSNNARIPEFGDQSRHPPLCSDPHRKRRSKGPPALPPCVGRAGLSCASGGHLVTCGGNHATRNVVLAAPVGFRRLGGGSSWWSRCPHRAGGTANRASVSECHLANGCCPSVGNSCYPRLACGRRRGRDRLFSE